MSPTSRDSNLSSVKLLIMQRDAITSAGLAEPIHHPFVAIRSAISLSLSRGCRRFTTRRRADRPVWPRDVLVINGHPDPRPERFCAALCNSYMRGLQASGRNVRCLEAGNLTFHVPADSKCARPTVPQELEPALRMIQWAQHLAVVFPLWLDQVPSPLERLLHVASERNRDASANNVLTERTRPTARIIVTMEMPAFLHRSTLLSTNWTKGPFIPLPGIKQSKTVFIGCVKTISAEQRQSWLNSMYALGQAGA
jgi:putative NADPH-quinone reductase